MDKLHKLAKSIISYLFATYNDFDEVVRVRQSHENSADYEHNIIRLNLRDDEDFGFMRHLRECHSCELNGVSPMLWTILHEVGHFMTANEIPPQDYDEAISTKVLLTLYGDKIKTDENLQNLYFNTATEWAATEWAVNYTENFYEEALVFSRELEALR